MGKRRLLSGAVALLVVLLLVLGVYTDGEKGGRVTVLSQWQLGAETVTLPCIRDQMQPRTPVTLTAQVRPKAGDFLYIKTVYAPLRVYADEELLYEYGQPGTYPAFLRDPPTKVALLPLPGEGETVELRLEYLTPTQRDSINLSAPLMGSWEALLFSLFSTQGFSLTFSVVLFVLGLLLLLVSLVTTRFERGGIAFFWLGLFSVCVGFWVFGECNLTGLLVDSEVFLYLLAFLGLFTMVIPLLRFGQTALGLQPEDRRLLSWTGVVLEGAVCVCLLLQGLGASDFSRTVFLFHLLLPLALLVFAGVLLRERHRWQNQRARAFLLPTAVLAAFALLEVGNFYLFRLNVQKSFFFQLGVLAFILMVSVLCGQFVRDAFLLREKNRQLSWEMALLEKQIQVQSDRYRLLSENAAQVRRQRHDLKHHIQAIRVCLERGETAELSAYLDQLSAAIPAGAEERLCENPLVNAVALHYQAQARESGTACTIRLDIPRDTGQVPESALCVIVGNLMENAAAACREVEGASFLRLQSRYSDGILTLVLDNSCTQRRREADGRFASDKAGGGVGLRSIEALAERYQGGCRFEETDGVFSSSVYLRLSP